MAAAAATGAAAAGPAEAAMAEAAMAEAAAMAEGAKEVAEVATKGSGDGRGLGGGTRAVLPGATGGHSGEGSGGSGGAGGNATGDPRVA